MLSIFCRGGSRAALVGNPRRIRQTRTFGVILFATRSIIMGAAPILVALLLTSSATAQKPKAANDLQSIEMCNGSGRISIEPRIAGCTRLIESHQSTPTAKAIAYNNRGNAFIIKGDYEHA